MGEAEPTTLVLVDDHVALRQGVELLLGRRGHVIAGATGDADEALGLICSVRPDVAVIDLGLGHQSGTGLARRVLVHDPELRVLLYTGSDDPELISEALDCGARGLALKGGCPTELIEAIRVVKSGGTYVDPRLSSRGLGSSTPERVHELSPREREVLDLLARGHTGEQAAKVLFLSPETVRTHVRNAMTRLDARTRVHAVTLALHRREIPLGDPQEERSEEHETAPGGS